MSVDMVTIKTLEGEGEAYQIKSPLGVQATTWQINLPWASWTFAGSCKLMLAHVDKQIAEHTA